MNEIFIQILLFSLIPAVSMIGGGLMGSNIAVTSKFRSFMLHLAAGVIFAVVAVEMLPEIMEHPRVIPVSIGFFAGVILMLCVKYFTHKQEKKIELAKQSNVNTAKKIIPIGLLLGIGIDLFLDGFLIGIGFAAGEKQGLLLTVALSLEIAALGLVVSTELKHEKHTKSKIFSIISILALFIVLGAVTGALLLNVITPDFLSILLAFGLSALIYLITEELLVEAHNEHDTVLNTAVFFVGFFAFTVIEMF